MNSFTVFMAFALATVVVAEPPSGYNYNRPQGGGGGGGGFIGSGSSGSFSSVGGGGGFSSGGGGGYQAVPSGVQTSEGQYVDPQLLEQVRQILLREESQSGGGSGGFGGHSGGGGGGAPSGSYGPPQPTYGVPSHSSRVVGIDLEGVRQAIQVAQYSQVSQSQGGYPSGPSGGGYPSGPSAPSGSYGAPSRPSGSYGAPF